MATLTFYDERHRYEVDGVPVPSVSEIMRFAAREVYGNVNQYTLDHAADRGTQVHAACLQLDTTGTVDITSDLVPYLEAYAAFVRKETPQWMALEQPLNVDTEYAGTIDRVGVLPKRGMGLALVDIKTTSALKTPLLTIQLAAYRRLWNHNHPDRPVDTMYALHLRRDGTHYLKPITHEPGLWNACQALHTALTPKRRRQKTDGTTA